MAIPTPPPDASGGFMVIKYADGVQTHRMRVHVLDFTPGSDLAYVAPPAGGDTGVIATYTAIAAALAEFFSPATSITLDAVYQIVAGVPEETFGWNPVAATAGTSGAANSSEECFFGYHFRTTNGGRAQFYLLGPAGWGNDAPTIINAGSASPEEELVSVFTSATTGVVGHDGYKLSSPARSTSGLNKRLRRKAGHA